VAASTDLSAGAGGPAPKAAESRPVRRDLALRRPEPVGALEPWRWARRRRRLIEIAMNESLRSRLSFRAIRGRPNTLAKMHRETAGAAESKSTGRERCGALVRNGARKNAPRDGRGRGIKEHWARALRALVRNDGSISSEETTWGRERVTRLAARQRHDSLAAAPANSKLLSAGPKAGALSVAGSRTPGGSWQ